MTYGLNIMQDALNEMAAKPVTSLIASGATFAAGGATWAQVINPVVGLIASILGIVLTCTLIYCNIQKHSLERRLILKRLGELDD